MDDLAEAANEAMSTHPAAVECFQDRALNRFKIVVYRHVRDLRERGHLRDLERFVENRIGGPQSITFDRNPFHWALYGLKLSGLLDFDLTSNSINSIGWQLLHADRHNVEPNLLPGFIFQTAATSLKKQNLIKDRGTVYHERWFDK